jgi:hypothetical protein
MEKLFLDQMLVEAEIINRLGKRLGKRLGQTPWRTWPRA